MEEENEENQETELRPETLAKFEAMLDNNTYSLIDAEQYLELIYHYLSFDNYQKAIKACEIGLEAHPYSTDIMIEYGTLLIIENRNQEARQIIEKAEVLDKHALPLVMLRARLYNAEGSFYEAIEYLLEEEHFVDEADELYHTIGMFYASTSQWDEAYKYFSKALNINFDRLITHLEIALIAEASKRYDLAITLYNDAIDQTPYNHEAWIHLGKIYNDSGDYTKAIDAYEYAIAIEANLWEAYFFMGDSYMNLEDYQEAAIRYHKAADLAGDNAEILVRLGASYEQQEIYDTAFGFYKKATQLDKTYDDAWYGMGMCLLEQEKYYESIVYLEKAIVIDNTKDYYYIALGEAEYALGNMLAAITAYDSAAEIDGTNPDLWLDYSIIYYDSGDMEKAISLIEEGIEEIPDNADLYYRAVVYYLKTGNRNKALQHLEHAMVLDYNLHTTIFDFFPEPETQANLKALIERYRNNQ